MLNSLQSSWSLSVEKFPHNPSIGLSSKILKSYLYFHWKLGRMYIYIYICIFRNSDTNLPKMCTSSPQTKFYRGSSFFANEIFWCVFVGWKDLSPHPTWQSIIPWHCHPGGPLDSPRKPWRHLHFTRWRCFTQLFDMAYRRNSKGRKFAKLSTTTIDIYPKSSLLKLSSVPPHLLPHVLQPGSPCLSFGRSTN